MRIYKRSQDNLILESSRDKLKDLIKIDKYGSEDRYVVWDDSFNKLSLDLSISGDFEFFFSRIHS